MSLRPQGGGRSGPPRCGVNPGPGGGAEFDALAPREAERIGGCRFAWLRLIRPTAG